MRAKPRNLRRGIGRCLCGIRTTLHFTPNNRKFSCDEAREQHARASVRPIALADLLRAAR